MIAFVSTRRWQLRDLRDEEDGSRQTRLTRNEVDDFDPAWSLDGTKIAFASARDATSRST